MNRLRLSGYAGHALALLVLLVVCLLLGGCQTTQPGSVAGGECRIFERPPYAVRGLRPYDQDWIDSQVEGGVGGCGWSRPEPRPASIDAAGTPPHSVAAPAPKRSLISRVRARLKRTPRPAAPVAPSPAEPAPVLEELPAPPPPPPDPVDQLLDRSGPAIGKFQDRVQ